MASLVTVSTIDTTESTFNGSLGVEANARRGKFAGSRYAEIALTSFSSSLDFMGSSDLVGSCVFFLPKKNGRRNPRLTSMSFASTAVLGGGAVDPPGRFGSRVRVVGGRSGAVRSAVSDVPDRKGGRRRSGLGLSLLP